MIKKDKKRFAELMAGMAEVFQKDLSQSLLGLYWNALQDISIAELEKAVSHIVMTRTITGTLPLPAEIIQAGGGSLEERAEIAWRTLVKTIEDQGYYQTVQFEDGATGHAVQALGGWMRICGDDPDWTTDNLKWRKKEFVNLYHNFARQNVPSVKLIGFHEANNAGVYEKYVPKIVYVGKQGDFLEIENKPEDKRKQITLVKDEFLKILDKDLADG
jgi:hypothetical protein